jgi:hypothetical protein
MPRALSAGCSADELAGAVALDFRRLKHDIRA